MSKNSYLSVIFAVAFFFAFSSMAFADDAVRFGNAYGDRLAVQNEYLNKNSGSPLTSLIQALKNVGVWNIIINLAPEFEQMASTADGLFHTFQKEKHAEDINIILGHFRDNWPIAINRMKKLKGSSAEVDINNFIEFMRTYQDLLDQSIHRDSQLEDSDIVKFMGQLTHLFNALESAYGNLYLTFKTLNLPIKIDWNIFQMSNKIVQMIPKELINTEFLKDIMQAPNAIFNELAQSIESLNDQIYDSPVGQYVPILLQVVENFVKNYVDQQNHRINREIEL
jgi:hypothetical protein